MARARNIKPSFFRNPDLADCSPYARLLFIGLWTMADREGRLEDRPRYIKFELMPSDKFDVDKELDALAERGFIIRYAINDARYIQVVNFKKHQNPHVKEAPSTIPAPDEHHASTVQDAEGQVQATLNPESPLLNPESPPTPPEGEGDRPKLESIDGGKKPPSAHERRFVIFWDAYPNKVGKQAVRKWWDREKPDDDLLRRMIEAIDRQKRTDQWQREKGRFIPHPYTWLNQGRWDDEPAALAPEKPAAPKPAPKPRTDEEILIEQALAERDRLLKGRATATLDTIRHQYDRQLQDNATELARLGYVVTGVA